MKEFWVPEDYVYEYASDCLLAHPEQAASLVRDSGEVDEIVRNYEKIKEIIMNPEYDDETATIKIEQLMGLY